MSIPPTPPQPTSFGKRLWLAFKKLFLFLLRVLLTLLILGAIAAALFYGTPVLYREYFMRDVDVNRSRIHDLNIQLDQKSEFFTQRLEELQSRLNILETQSDNDQQIISELNAQLAEIDMKLQGQNNTLDELDKLTTSLEALKAQIVSLEVQLAGFEDSLAGIQDEITGLNQSSESNQTAIEDLSAQLQTSATLVTLRQDLELLKAMELITRARVSIGQNNIGLARADVQSAHDLLTALSTEVTTAQAVYLSDVILRLELALKNLSSSQTLTHQDLEIAWQLLLNGLPEESSQDEQPVEIDTTPTPTPTVSP